MDVHKLVVRNHAGNRFYHYFDMQMLTPEMKNALKESDNKFDYELDEKLGLLPASGNGWRYYFKHAEVKTNRTSTVVSSSTIKLEAN